MVGTRKNPDGPEEDPALNPGADHESNLDELRAQLAALRAELSEERSQRLEERLQVAGTSSRE